MQTNSNKCLSFFLVSGFQEVFSLLHSREMTNGRHTPNGHYWLVSHTFSLVQTHTRAYHQRWHSLVHSSSFFQLICNNILITITNGHSKSLVSALLLDTTVLHFPVSCVLLSIHPSLIHTSRLPSLLSKGLQGDQSSDTGHQFNLKRCSDY